MKTIDANEIKSSGSLDKKKIGIGIGIVTGIVLIGIIVFLLIPKENTTQTDTFDVYESAQSTYKSKGVNYTKEDFEKDKAVIDKLYEEQKNQNVTSSATTNNGSGGGTSTSSENNSSSYSVIPLNLDDMSDSYKELEKKNDEVIQDLIDEKIKQTDDEGKDKIKEELNQINTQTLSNNILNQNQASLNYVNKQFGNELNTYNRYSYDNYIAKVYNYLSTDEAFSNEYTEEIPLNIGAAYMKYYTTMCSTYYDICSYENIYSSYMNSANKNFVCDYYTSWFKIQPSFTKIYSIVLNNSSNAAIVTDSGKYSVSFALLTSSEDSSSQNAQFLMTDLKKGDSNE